jgi:putative transcriptional regulator
MSRRPTLKGKLLIAMPSIQGDWFSHSVVFLCEHSADGAMGLVLNKPAPQMYFADLAEKLELGRAIPEHILLQPIMLGGPVKTFQGFVLHSSDFIADGSHRITGDFSLNTTVEILKAIALGKGPRRQLIALGYAGWTANQLDSEILNNGWLHCDADPDLVFGHTAEGLHHAALAKLGVDPRMLSSEAGHA